MSELTTKILVVDDDLRLRSLLERYLTEHGYHVKTALNGQYLDRALEREAFHLIVLDVMLPGEDGFALCRSVRSTFEGPLLFLTAKTELSDELLGFELGADDFITKPVEPSVLLARIHALLRRSGVTPDTELTELTFDQLNIDQLARRVILANEPIDLTSHEFDLLVMLAANAGKVVERNLIYTELIGREYDGLDRSADVRISRLRKKLGDNAQQPFRIKTIWGKGFFFVADAWK